VQRRLEKSGALVTTTSTSAATPTASHSLVIADLDTSSDNPATFASSLASSFPNSRIALFDSGLHPAQINHLKSLGITGKVYAGFFAIVSEKLSAEAERRSYKPFGLQPAALRDLALVVPEATTSAEVQKALAKVARAAVGMAFALEAVHVFDVYQGKGLPEGTKSLAYSLVFRAAERTLTDDEVNTVFVKIQDELLKTTPYQIRK
jgi:hypothetical protein